VDPGLYAIVDLDALGEHDPLLFARAVLSAGRLSALQLRAKTHGARRVLSIGTQLRGLCAAASVPFVMNDRPDLAAIVGADMVHVGQDDLPVGIARALAPACAVGVSTHSDAQLDEALALRPAYVAIGPVYRTRTKERPDPVVGVDTFAARAARAARVGIPAVAIGGIDLAGARALREAGARSAAVIAAILEAGPDAWTIRAREIHRALGGG